MAFSRFFTRCETALIFLFNFQAIFAFLDMNSCAYDRRFLRQIYFKFCTRLLRKSNKFEMDPKFLSHFREKDIQCKNNKIFTFQTIKIKSTLYSLKKCPENLFQIMLCLSTKSNVPLVVILKLNTSMHSNINNS